MFQLTIGAVCKTAASS